MSMPLTSLSFSEIMIKKDVHIWSREKVVTKDGDSDCVQKVWDSLINTDYWSVDKEETGMT